ncbi:MAG: fasciclin domain-containing protein [Flavobacteriaceae bacterium]
MNYSNKFFKPLTKMVMIGLVLFSLTSCSDDDSTSTPPQTSTITDIVVNNPDFSILRSAVVKAGLAETLAGEGTFTIFAPDNDAFAASGITSADIEAMSVADLTSILLYHALDSEVPAADVPAGPNAAVQTINESSIFLTKNSSGVFVNGISVKQADVEASNGVIHVISKVLMPATGNIVEVAQSNQDFSYLVAAVVRASQGDTDVEGVLSSEGPFTVFAPVNQAFIDAGFPDIASIQAADPNTLTAILTYHVIGARAFSSDLVDGANLSTVNGGTIEVGLGATATVKGNSNDDASNIIAVDILTTNGVIHVIDRVLLP